MQWMKGGDQCSRVFFRKIAQRRSARRIFQINDDQGSTHTDPEEVINEFVTYYQNLLGGHRRRTVVDIRFLRPWARHILSNEESTTLLLPFTPVDVKQAVFDIDEDKAPGPDGYSSGFFKAAWPIVGQEVTSAVLDFFSTGRLLKQINTTLLALIPKVYSPMTLIDLEEIFSYHWKCEAARIFQLGFADDVILFCRADMDSLRIFKAGLDRFAEWSGLRLNVQKSHLIISRSAQALREEIPRYLFILWLAILGKLPTTDKPWLSHFGDCILCNEGPTETLSHLFFQCRFSRQCLTAIRRKIRFHWPNRDWANDIEWDSRR
ncbi:UNVERIFIED_CONTAM: hypothetical protein Sindi_2936800 [Sesamum indicum]